LPSGARRWRGDSFSDFENRCELGKIETPISNFQKFGRPILPREAREGRETLARRARRGSPSAGSKSLRKEIRYEKKSSVFDKTNLSLRGQTILGFVFEHHPNNIDQLPAQADQGLGFCFTLGYFSFEIGFGERFADNEPFIFSLAIFTFVMKNSQMCEKLFTGSSR